MFYWGEMMRVLSILVLGIFVLQSALGASETTSSQKQGYIQRKMNFAHRKITSTSTGIRSCTKDCSGPSLCTNEKRRQQCQRHCSHKIDFTKLQCSPVHPVEVRPAENIPSLASVAHDPIPDPTGKSTPGKWVSPTNGSGAYGAIHQITVIKQSRTQNGETKFEDADLEKIKSIFMGLSLSLLKGSKMASWVATQGGGIKNSYADACTEKDTQDIQKKFNDYVQKHPNMKPGANIFYVNTIFYRGILERRPSSGQGNNCLLFSFIGENKALLTAILGSAQKAQDIMQHPEMGNGTCRNFSPVRTAVMAKIRSQLDAPFISFSSGEETTLRGYLTELSRDEGHQGNVNDLLSNLSVTDLYLDSRFAAVFAYLYKTTVLVLNPNPENRSELRPNEFLPLAAPSGTPIFIYHSGMHGVHYEKLIPVA